LFTFSSLPHHYQPLQQQPQTRAGDVNVEEPVNEHDNARKLSLTPDSQQVPDNTLTAHKSDLQPSTRSDFDRLQRRASAEASDNTQIVVDVHPAILSDEFKVIGDRSTASRIRSSAPELHLVTRTDLDAHDTHEPESRGKRQFVVVTVADDVARLSTYHKVHTASSVRRTGSCKLPSRVRSPTTTKRFVISLTNLDAGKFTSDTVLPQSLSFSPLSSQPVSSTIASACLSDQAASAAVMLEAPTSLASPRCPATSDRDCREVSKELWSLRALLANHSDISMDESVDEATATEATSSTTPQSADDVSVKSSADTVISVDARPLPTASTATAPLPAMTTIEDSSQQPTNVPEEQASGGDDGITRKPSIRRQNYREAIARRQNNRIQTAAAASVNNELSIPTSSVEASSEPTDTESSMSFEWWTYPASSAASSNETTASSFGDSMTSTDSVAGGSGSDGHGGVHRLEQLRGDSGYRSLETQQSVGQARDFRCQSASHFLLDSSANVIYEDQMSMATSYDDVRSSASPSSVVVSVQQMQYSTALGASIPVSLPIADSTASGSANMRSGHRHNKAAQRKRIQYRCDRQDVEIHDSMAVGDPIEYKVTRQSHHHHHHHHQHHHYQQQQQPPHPRSIDVGSVAENLEERDLTTPTATTTTMPTTKPSLFSRFLRTAHIGSGSGGSGVASRRSSLSRMQRDYSIDERSNAIFNEFVRHDPVYDTKHTLNVHAHSSRSARRSRTPRSQMPRSSRRRIPVEERSSSTAEMQRTEVQGQSHTAPNTTSTSPLLIRKYQLVEALADPRSTSLLGDSSPRGRRRSEGSNRLGSDVTSAIAHATSYDIPRGASTYVDQSPFDNRPSPDIEQTTAESMDTFPTHQRHDDYGSDVADIRPPLVSTSSEHDCTRRSAATSHRIPVIQLTTEEDTLQ